MSKMKAMQKIVRLNNHPRVRRINIIAGRKSIMGILATNKGHK